MAVTKAEACENMHEESELLHGQKKISWLGKNRNKATSDILHVKSIKDAGGSMLSKEEEVRER